MMNRLFFFLIMLSFVQEAKSQAGFIWTKKEFMPEKISNNAVCAAQLGDTHYVFSFAGIDSTKLFSGIHLRSYRYNFEADRWDTIPALPDTLGKIATAASHVNGKIYITGGYHVLGNGNEISSDKIHIYDVASNSFLPDGAPIPFPIDDHVQAVWRDSLIYLITGWSNNGSYPYVQVYNTYTDTWAQATQTPSTSIYRCFGASGMIIGDTIYYYGGVSGSFTFTAQSYLRKGIIDPQNPLNITWSQLNDSPGDAGYRTAPFHYNDQLFWLGGAGIAYNYNGIAYNGSGGVPPLSRILQYNATDNYWYDHFPTPFNLMDFRGSGEIETGKIIICGGMSENQEVMNTTYLIEFDTVFVGIKNNINNLDNPFYPNPSSGILHLKNIDKIQKINIFTIGGTLVYITEKLSPNLQLNFLPEGIYILEIVHENGIYREKWIIQK